MQNQKRKVKNYDKIDWGFEMEPDDIIKYAKKANCRSLAFTYNEPTIFTEFCLETMKLGRKNGFKNVWVSNGFMSD